MQRLLPSWPQVATYAEIAARLKKIGGSFRTARNAERLGLE